MVWGIILLFLLRIALPVFVGFGLGILLERWQTTQEKVVQREAYTAQPGPV